MGLYGMVYDSTATLQKWMRQSNTGPVYDLPFEGISCKITGKQTKVSKPIRGTNIGTVAEVTGNFIMLCDLKYEPEMVPDSKITCNNREYTVLAANPKPWMMGSHLEVILL